MQRFGWRSRGLVSVVGTAVFAIIVALLPLFKDDYSPVEDAISHGAVGPFGYLQVIAFFALGLGTLALALGLWEQLGGRASKIGSALVGLSGLGFVIVGIFPADLTPEPETVTGTIHIAVSLLSFVALIVGILICPGRSRARRRGVPSHQSRRCSGCWLSWLSSCPVPLGMPVGLAVPSGVSLGS